MQVRTLPCQPMTHYAPPSSWPIVQCSACQVLFVVARSWTWVRCTCGHVEDLRGHGICGSAVGFQPIDPDSTSGARSNSVKDTGPLLRAKFYKPA